MFFANCYHKFIHHNYGMVFSMIKLMYNLTLKVSIVWASYNVLETLVNSIYQ